MDFMLLFVIWIATATFSGFIGLACGSGFWKTFLLSTFCSPVVAIGVALGKAMFGSKKA